MCLDHLITGELIGGVITSPNITLSGTDTYISSQQTCAGTYYNKLYLYFNGMDYDFVLNINAVRVKAVTAPSYKVSQSYLFKGGTTYNWENKDASFTYNSDITYSIYDRDLTAYADGNHQIEIYDSSNRMLKGVLKAAGTGETVGGDILSGWDLTSGWIPTNVTVNDSNTFTLSAANEDIYRKHMLRGQFPRFIKRYLVHQFLLVTHTFVIREGSSTIANASESLGIARLTGMLLRLVSGKQWRHHRCNSPYDAKKSSPPHLPTANIVSTGEGETYNFSYKNPSFKYNAASYYVIIRAIR